MGWHGASIVDVDTSWNRISKEDQERFMASGITRLSYRAASGMDGCKKLFHQWKEFGDRNGIHYEFCIHDWIGEAEARADRTAGITPNGARAECEQHFRWLQDLADEGFDPYAIQINAEWMVWRGRMVGGKRHAHELAVESLHAYHDRVEDLADPGGVDPEVHYLGFMRPQRYYEGIKRIPVALKERTPVICPMLYGDDPDTSLDRTTKDWKCHNRVHPYLPVGRWDKGEAVGDEDKSMVISRRVPGVWWYFGNGSQDQFTRGNREHRSIAGILEGDPWVRSYGEPLRAAA